MSSACGTCLQGIHEECRRCGCCGGVLEPHTIDVYGRWTDGIGHAHVHFQCRDCDLRGNLSIAPVTSADVLVAALTNAPHPRQPVEDR